jgi:hypothetical protein
MSFSGSQGADLMQAALVGSYDFYLEREGAWLDQSAEGSVNIPWVLDLALSEGNATTVAIGQSAWTWPEPEWGWDTTGPGQDTRLQQWMGGGIGGWIRSW